MKLRELDPRWYSAQDNGPKVGFTFNCPHCSSDDLHRLGVAVHQDGLIDPEPSNPKCWPPGYVWEMSGGENWDTLSLTPSVDASQFGHWHGFIKNGNIQ
jgi:hypothetical protein